MKYTIRNDFEINSFFLLSPNSLENYKTNTFKVNPVNSKHVAFNTEYNFVIFNEEIDESILISLS